MSDDRNSINPTVQPLKTAEFKPKEEVEAEGVLKQVNQREENMLMIQEAEKDKQEQIIRKLKNDISELKIENAENELIEYLESSSPSLAHL